MRISVSRLRCNWQASALAVQQASQAYRQQELGRASIACEPTRRLKPERVMSFTGKKRDLNMSKQETLPRARCQSEGHSKHLCSLTDGYFHVHCPDEFRQIAKDARFKCQFCGRTARFKENLCYPVEL